MLVLLSFIYIFFPRFGFRNIIYVLFKILSFQTFLCSFDWQLQCHQSWLSWFFIRHLVYRSNNCVVVTLPNFGAMRPFWTRWPIGTFDVLIPFLLLRRVRFEKKLFCINFFWKGFPTVEYWNISSWKLWPFIYVTLVFDSASLFSVWYLILTFKTYIASSFGDKMSDFFNLGHLFLKSLDFGKGLCEDSSKL